MEGMCLSILTVKHEDQHHQGNLLCQSFHEIVMSDGCVMGTRNPSSIIALLSLLRWLGSVWLLLGQCMLDKLAMSVNSICLLVGIIAFRSKEFDDR
jgi:hypothetical protein